MLLHPHARLFLFFLWLTPACRASAMPESPRVLLETTYAPSAGARIEVRSGNDLQKAIDEARPGDEVLLEAGARFEGNFVLPNKGAGSNWVVIRSSRMESLPQAGKRVNPTHAAAMPKLVTRNANAALTAAAGANHYRIMGLEIAVAPKVALNYSTVYLNGDTLEALPSDIVFDRVYVHGAVLCHCKTGITLNSRRTAVIDSYISEYHSIDQDTQAILGYNGPGPFKIVNNHLEASGENIMFGGAPASIPGLVPSDIEFRKNYLYKPIRWRSGIIPKPQAPSVKGGGKGGLAAGNTYYYVVVAAGPADYEPTIVSDPSDETAVTLSSDQTSAVLSWRPVMYGDWADSRTAAEYRIFRTSAPPSASVRQWTSFKLPAGLSFTDTGAAGTPGAPGRGPVWIVKNHFELKNAQRVLVDGNVMENCWQQAQEGHSILVLPRTEGGRMPWAVTQDLIVTNNLIRHTGGGALIGGMDDACAGNPGACRQSSRVLVRNNVFDDIDKAKWGGRAWAMMIMTTDAAAIEHNTFVNGSAVLFWMGTTNSGLSLDSNIGSGNVCGDGLNGTAALDRYAPGAISLKNVLVGLGSFITYYDRSGANAFPVSWNDVQFADFARGDYRLTPASPFKKFSNSGRDPGANMDEVLAATAGVASGMTVTGQPAIVGVRNAAALTSSAVAPGSLIAVLADGFAGEPLLAAGSPLPSELASVSLFVNDLPAPLLSVAPGQIVAQVPFEIPSGPAQAAVAVGPVMSAPFSFTVADAAPGLFVNESGRALAFNADAIPNSPVNPAARGTVLTAYVTGQGAVEPNPGTGVLAAFAPLSIPALPLTADIGGQNAPVVFSGLTPGTAGVSQVNVVVPDLPAGDYPLAVTVGPARSNQALIAIY